MKEWKPIDGYEGVYSVSSEGEVMRIKRGQGTTGRTLLKLSKNNNYQSVSLWNNGTGKSKRVHRIVAETFLPNPENRPEVNHKNGIKHDNRVENLEWVTRSENEAHITKWQLKM